MYSWVLHNNLCLYNNIASKKAFIDDDESEFRLGFGPKHHYP